MPKALIQLYIHNIRLSFCKENLFQLTALPFLDPIFCLCLLSSVESRLPLHASADPGPSDRCLRHNYWNYLESLHI